jgi:hypothetical protein
MIALSTLQRRLDKLEPRPTTEPDIVSLVLTTLKDSDIELLQELASLREAGFDEEQTVSMMGDRYGKAMKAVEAFQERYQAIQEQMKSKTKPRKPAQNGRDSVEYEVQIRRM